MTAAARFTETAARAEGYLRTLFAHQTRRGDLYEAMEYSLFAGGKRLRPVLVLEACRFCGGGEEAAMPLACAVELVHTYSLIHDDLPAMDDDDLRRGKPTCHRVYGEATAILAGDALLTAAFETILSAHGLTAEQRTEAGLCLAKAAGAEGMIAGQILDMAGQGREALRDEVEELQKLKTGALIRAACELGWIAAGGSEAQRSALCKFGEKFGLAFQVRDDMLDVEGDAASLGKPIGSDAASRKATFVSLLGLSKCRALVEKLTDEASAALDGTGDAERLQTLVREMKDRSS